ncbi:DUF3618 domain-containing protein [Nocardia sp. NPDC003482]|uniref:DUF3618 domain-containing protein n=1 Tax=Nocardia sp. NPDC004068 TaxID=3364303 RepID=UPI0036B49177
MSDIPSDPEQLRRDRDRTREELGQTVEALTEKFDVPGRARAKAQELRGRAEDATPDVVVDGSRQAAGVVRAYPVPIVGAGVLVALVIWFLARRRSA